MELQPRAATGGPVSTFRIGGPRWDRGRWRHSLPRVPGSRQIAGLLGLSIRTVENHRANLMGKLGLTSRVELMNYAEERGLI